MCPFNVHVFGEQVAIILLSTTTTGLKPATTAAFAGNQQVDSGLSEDDEVSIP